MSGSLEFGHRGHRPVETAFQSVPKVLGMCFSRSPEKQNQQQQMCSSLSPSSTADRDASAGQSVHQYGLAACRRSPFYRLDVCDHNRRTAQSQPPLPRGLGLDGAGDEDDANADSEPRDLEDTGTFNPFVDDHEPGSRRKAGILTGENIPFSTKRTKKLRTDIDDTDDKFNMSHETRSLANDQSLNPFAAHAAMRPAPYEHAMQPYKKSFRNICGGPDSNCEKRAQKPILNQLIVRASDGAQSGVAEYFSTFLCAGKENSYSSVKWDFGHTATPEIKFYIIVHNDHTQMYDGTMFGKLPRVFAEASIALVPGQVEMDGRPGPSRCFKDHDVQYTSPEELQDLDKKCAHTYAEAQVSIGEMESSENEANTLLAVPKEIREATIAMTKAAEVKAQTRAEKEAANPPGATFVDKGKAKDTPSMPGRHVLFGMHALKFNCQAVVAQGFEQPGILRVLEHPYDYPEETVRNIRFMRNLVRRLQKLPNGQVPLAYYWQYPDSDIKLKLDTYKEQAVRPFIHSVINDHPWFYPYLDSNRELDFHKIPDAFDVGDGMLVRGIDGAEIAKYQSFVKFNSISDMRTVRAIVDQRVFTTPEAQLQALATKKVTCHVVHMNSPSNDIEMTDDNSDKGKGKNKWDRTEVREYFKIFVSFNAAGRNALRNEVLHQGQSFSINFILKGAAPVPEHLRWVGTCMKLGTSEDPCIVEGYQFDVVLLAYRPAKGQVVNSFDSIEEALKYNRHGTRAYLTGRISTRPLLYAQLANMRLSSPHFHRFARILAGCASENHPDPQNPKSYPMVMPKASHDSKNTIHRTSEEVTAYDNFVKDFDNVNKNPGWGLDESQRNAVLLATEQRLINLVRGPPGAGKTKTLAAAALMHARIGKKAIICAPTNTAVDGLALCLQEMTPLDFEISILREHVPGAEQQFASLSEDEASAMPAQSKEDAEVLAMQQLGDMNTGDIGTWNSAESAFAVIGALQPKHFYTKSLSTAAYIRLSAIRNVKVYSERDSQSLSSEETELYKASKTILDLWPTFTAMPSGEEKQNAAQDFNAAMDLLRIEAYENISIVITTCGNAANKVLAHGFRPDSCFVDDAAQGGECDIFIPSTAFTTVKQYHLYGDDHQLACTAPFSPTNEMAESIHTSTFERLRMLGIPVHTLTIQYRMTETCNVITNKVFYDGKIETAEMMKAENKVTPAIRKFIRHHMFQDNDESHREVVMIDMRNSVGYKDQHTYSTVNPVEANFTAELICQILLENPDLKPEQFGVICMYKAQIKEVRTKTTALMRKLADERHPTFEQVPDISKAIYYTVDSSQGREVDISIINLGGCGTKDFTDRNQTVDYPNWDNLPHISRHVEDFRRVNVATSRHRYAMFLVGNREGLLKGLEKHKNTPKLRALLELCETEKFVFVPKDPNRYEETENKYITDLYAQRQLLI